MASVSLTPDDLPDVEATLDSEGYYTIAITGLTGLDDPARDPTKEERDAGIVTLNPPTVRVADTRGVELVMLRAIEGALPDGLLDNTEGVDGAVDKEHLLLAQVTRVVRLALITLETPE